jgi:hypothetical protein
VRQDSAQKEEEEDNIPHEARKEGKVEQKENDEGKGIST